MNIESLREYCLAKKGVVESMPFGPEALVFKVMGKVFLIASLESEPLQFNIKCDPEKAVELRETYTCVIPGFHMNKKHWNTILVDQSASTICLQNWITDSYELVVSKLTKRVKSELSGL